MAIGDYTKTTYVNGSAPALNATNLNNAENKIDEIDTFAATLSAIPAGTMTMFAGSSAPTGWLICDGSAVSRTTYSALFSAISTTWGVGDNSTTFNLPDMREASPYGAGTFSAVAGTTHGSITEHDALALGAFADDRGQGHRHSWAEGASSNNVGHNRAGSGGQAGNISALGANIGDPSTDGTNGTPRTGKTTRGKIIGVNFIIKA